MRPDRLGLIQYLLLIITIVVVLVFIQTRATDLQTHNRLVELMLQLQQEEGELDRHVLATAALLLDQYDPFVTTERRMAQLLEALEGEHARRDRDPFNLMLGEYQAVLDSKRALAERIKSRAALLRNGLHFLPLTVGELHLDDHRLGDKLSTLLNDLLRYQLFPGVLEARSIDERLDEVEFFSEPEDELRQKLDNIVFHMRTNLALIGNIQDLEWRYQALPGKQRLEALYQWELEEYVKQADRADLVSQLLMFLTVVLLTSLGLALRRLAVARKQAEHSWNQLREAVESLSEAFALYAKDGRLVLYNSRFLAFYPWLKECLGSNASLSRVRSLNVASGRVVELPGAEERGAQDTTEQTYVEQLDDGRWYLASDSRTSDGETACVRVDITESKRTEQELRKLYRALEQSPATVVITDTKGNIEYVNPKFEETTGYKATEALGQNPRLLKSGDKSPEEYKEMWDTITAGKVWRGQFHNKRKDGQIYWEAASISPVRDGDGQITHFIAVKEDITAQKRAEDQLRMNATVFDTTTEGIMVTDADNRIKTVNPAFSRITGYAPQEVIGRKPDVLSSGRHDQAFYDSMWNSLSGTGYWSGEIWNRRKDGSVYPEWLSLAAIPDAMGGVQEYVAVFSDITRRKQDEEQIRRQANFDALTGLPNRSLLVDRLDRSISSAQREDWQVALLFIDLDRFKGVNDTLGHVVGDELLQQVAERLCASVREADTVARFGGDEFVIVLEDIRQANDAAEIGKKVIAALDRVFNLAGREVFIGASIGISLYPDDAKDPGTMLRNADMAMYRAKDAGRNNYQFFTLTMNEQVQQRMALERDLRLALERDELALCYQPIVQLGDNRMVAVEALLRWRHSEHGVVNPDRFIPLAEETGLIGPIGHWVLREACRQTARWRSAGLTLKLHVNLSSRQLALGLAVEEIANLLRETGLPADMLELEITEGLMLEGEDATLQWLEQIQTLGVGLAVDDFGTGYSSLSYLKRFPMDMLKIDRAFVRDLPGYTEDASLVQAIIAMAQSLGLEVLAEGVETREQLDFLHSLGCELVQGYLYSPPVWPERIPELAGQALPAVGPEAELATAE